MNMNRHEANKENDEQRQGRVRLRSSSGTVFYSVLVLENLPVYARTIYSDMRREIHRRQQIGEPALKCTVDGGVFGGTKRAASLALRRAASRCSSNAPSTASDGADSGGDGLQDINLFRDDISVSAASVASASSDRSSPHVMQQLVSVEQQPQSTQDFGNNAWHSTRVSWRACNASLETCHRSFLINKINDLQGKLAEAKSELGKSRRSQKQAVKQQNKLQIKLANASTVRVTDEAALTLAKTTRRDGETGARFTARGFLSLGIRKALAVTSAVAFPLAALCDVSRQTVTRSENLTWSVLVARTSTFHALVRQRLRNMASAFLAMELEVSQDSNENEHRAGDNPDPAFHGALVQEGNNDADPFDECSADRETVLSADLGLQQIPEQDAAMNAAVVCRGNPLGNLNLHSWFGFRRDLGNVDSMGNVFCLGGTCLAGDATNSGIWRRNKLQGLMLTSACMTDSQHLSSDTNFLKAFAFHTTVFPGVDEQ